MENTQVNQIEEALNRRDRADFQAFLKLKELMDMTDYNPGRQNLLEIIAEYSGYDIEEATEFIKEIEAVIQEREDANEELLQAIKDNPIVPEKG